MFIERPRASYCKEPTNRSLLVLFCRNSEFIFFCCFRLSILLYCTKATRLIPLRAKSTEVSLSHSTLPINCISFRYQNYCVYIILHQSAVSLNIYIYIYIYRTINFPVVLYGCEAWSLTLREERKLRVFENMVLRRIFGPRRDEVTGEWRRLHNEELNDLYPILCGW